MSLEDRLAKTQRWLIRIQFDTACHIQKLTPNRDSDRPGELYERRGQIWKLVGYIMPEDKEIGRITPVEITVYEDRSFEFITKTPPAAVLIKEALRLEKGSAEPNRTKVGRLSRAQVRSIAEAKLVDLNARDVEQAMKVIEGTARSMGVEVDA